MERYNDHMLGWKVNSLLFSLRKDSKTGISDNTILKLNRLYRYLFKTNEAPFEDGKIIDYQNYGEPLAEMTYEIGGAGIDTVMKWCACTSKLHDIALKESKRFINVPIEYNFRPF